MPDGLAQAWFCSWARCARFFIEKKKYISKYNTYTSILPISMAPGRGEWMDGVGSVWVTTSRLGKRSQLGLLGLGFGVGLAGLSFP